MEGSGKVRPNLPGARPATEQLGRRLDSWKEIAAYLDRSEKTVRRWEEKEDLPVHRLLHEKRGSVYAYTGELDAWRETRRPATESPALNESRPAIVEISKPPVKAESLARRAGLPLIGFSVLLIAIAIGWFVWHRIRIQPGTVTSERIRSMAVLPLRNLSGSSDHDFLAEGFTDAITTELGRSPDLHVISETSASVYKHTPKPLRTIAHELRAQYVVEGAVVPIGHQIRVNVRLVQAEPDRYLWSKSYDVDLGEAPRVEADIAEAIASEIHAKFTPRPNAAEAAVTTVSASAYEAYLKGKYMLARGTEESIRKAIDYFRTSIAEAPRYADAYVGLAESYTALSTTYAPPNQVMPEARQAAEIALRLDDTLSAAHAIRGKIATVYDWNWQDAEKHLKKAIELNGSLASAHVAYVDLLVARGRYEEVAGEVRKAQMLDPVSLANSVDLQLDAFDAEKFDLMTVCARKALEIDPNFSWAHTLMGWVAARKGNVSDGLARAEQGARSATSFEQFSLLGEVQLMAGRRRAAQNSLEKLIAQRRKSYVCGHAIGSLYAAMGRKEEALQWLETAYRERSDCIPFLKRDPASTALRMEPRFQRLLRQVHGN